MVQTECRANTTINNLVPHKEENILASWAGIRGVKTVYLSSLIFRPLKLKGPVHLKLKCAVYCLKNLHEVCYLAQHRFPIRFVSSVCLLVRVTMVDKYEAVVCCLLATSAIILSEKKKRNRKMLSKMWYGIKTN